MLSNTVSGKIHVCIFLANKPNYGASSSVLFGLQRWPIPAHLVIFYERKVSFANVVSVSLLIVNLGTKIRVELNFFNYY